MLPVGVMQGRLSPIKGDRIQSFPWQNWRRELYCFSEMGFESIEWTIDLWRYFKNPIIKSPALVSRNLDKVAIKLLGITSDAHMQSGDLSACDSKYKINRVNKLTRKLIKSAGIIGANYIVIPLVDNSSLALSKNRKKIIEFFGEYEKMLKEFNVMMLFEVDVSPSEVCEFIRAFNSSYYGINYDIGNSASLGFNFKEEYEAYGKHIHNVHVKDRFLNGQSCKLGQGDASLAEVKKTLLKSDYQYSAILQCARDVNGQHKKMLSEQKKYWDNL